MSESDLLKRLLFSVVFVHNESKSPRDKFAPTPGKITFLLRSLKSESSWTFDEDNIKSYLNGTVPRGKNQTNLLAAINFYLFHELKEKYIGDLNATFDTVKISASIRDQVEQQLREHSGNRSIANVLVAPDYEGIDPTDIDVHVRNYATDNWLKAHLLYHSPVAADIWDRVKTSKAYSSLYGLCEQGLRDVLESNEWNNRLSRLQLVFNLGAGSASKDELVLAALRQANSPSLTFAWVDASWPMLHRTIKQLDLRVDPKMSCIALIADFEQPGNLRNIYERSFPWLPEFTESKAFFILGFTLSNLNEMSFFSEYAKECSMGDLFVFPMQFIPEACKSDRTMLEAFKTQLRVSYNFEEGRKLSRAGLGILQKYTPNEFPDPVIDHFYFNGAMDSLCIKFSVKLKHNKSGHDITVVTARSIRHYEQDYLAFLQIKGFKKLWESREQNGVKTLLVEYVGQVTG